MTNNSNQFIFSWKKAKVSPDKNNPKNINLKNNR